MGLGNLSKVTYFVSKWEARFQTQFNLSLKPELSHKDMLSQTGESSSLIIQGRLKPRLCATEVWCHCTQ